MALPPAPFLVHRTPAVQGACALDGQPPSRPDTRQLHTHKSKIRGTSMPDWDRVPGSWCPSTLCLTITCAFESNTLTLFRSTRPPLFSLSTPLFPCAYMLSTCATKLKNTTIFCRPTYRGGSARHDCDSAYSHVNLEPCPTSIRLFRFVCCAAAGSLTSPINGYLELPWSFGRLFPRRSDPNTSRQ